MGPRRFRRGSLLPYRIGIWLAALQWGRDVSVAEVLSTARARGGITSLQWGRDVSVAEVSTWGFSSSGE